MVDYDPLERPVINESSSIMVTFGITLQQIIDVVSLPPPFQQHTYRHFTKKDYQKTIGKALDIQKSKTFSLDSFMKSLTVLYRDQLQLSTPPLSAKGFISWAIRA